MTTDEAAFDAGSPALNFANWAAANRVGLKGMEDYANMAEDAQQIGLIDGQMCGRLREQAKGIPFKADEALAEARILARVVHRIFAAVAKDSVPGSGDLDFLNTVLARAMIHLLVLPTGLQGTGATGAYEWAWVSDGSPDLDRMLWPVVRDAAELLVGQDPARVRLCQGADCDRLFLDISKAGRRRWCQMETCGNRAKARRYTERHFGAPGDPARGIGFQTGRQRGIRRDIRKGPANADPSRT